MAQTTAAPPSPPAGRASVDKRARRRDKRRGGMTARHAHLLRQKPERARVVLMNDVGDFVTKGVEDFVPAMLAIRLPGQHNAMARGLIVTAVSFAPGQDNFRQRKPPPVVPHGPFSWRIHPR